MSFEDLISKINNYSNEDKSLIVRAYEYAKVVHQGQVRKSGDAYISHPLSVACILAEMHADADTISAGLLHDSIEDGPGITKEILELTFNETVAYLVDGVTKMKKIEFNNDKKLTEAANNRKMIEYILQDIRILIIKLADRLHNMRTEDYQSKEKQIEHSHETMDFFVPFANLIGAYTYMLELQDISFKYLDPESYKKMTNLREDIKNIYKESNERLLIAATEMLTSNNIPFEIRTKIKPAYSLYLKYNEHEALSEIHDLYAIKILLQDVKTCYQVRDIIEAMYKVNGDKRKDYISHPKTNMYRSLHTSIISPEGFNFQFQIKTKEMYKINSYGLTAYWRLLKEEHKDLIAQKMMDEVRKFPFFNTLEEISKSDISIVGFDEALKKEVLEDKVYVYTPDDNLIELPKGSTVVDFAYKIHTDIGNHIISAKVNGEDVNLNYVLKNDDHVEIEYDLNKEINLDMLLSCSTTIRAKRKINAYKKTLSLN